MTIHDSLIRQARLTEMVCRGLQGLSYDDIPVIATETLEDARTLFEGCPSQCRHRSEYLHQWRAFSAAEIARATCPIQAREAYFRAYGGTPEKDQAREKWLGLLAEKLRSTQSEAEITYWTEQIPAGVDIQALYRQRVSAAA